MLAIVLIGGKQYSVDINHEIYVEKLPNKVGDVVQFTQVLMVNDKIGNPYLKDAVVECEVIKQGKQRKIDVIHHISQKHHTRKYGHRQPYTKLKVKAIKG
ncbi:50S ribosomal protein L21 [Candidatus Malacoplasma girerdii]|uniref:Large ribosomal subunit protein bL21 n=1 Tax=Candidatus Malacoplasma girerdii TaxID=1318617 RepID=A0A097SSI3_9BACT|nr:50S ribosomal protein L21 [Candidatus Malacoplasma girerdii]ASJ89095.1 MAG: 50S ribosomal protein L21 [Candidatus Malacoplasma girerdii]